MRKVIGIALGCLLAALCTSGAWAADAAAGKTTYDSKCKACHAADGTGNPAMAKMLKVDLKPIGGSSAEEVKGAVSKGKGKMKPVAGLSAADVDNVAAYVKTLKK